MIINLKSSKLKLYLFESMREKWKSKKQKIDRSIRMWLLTQYWSLRLIIESWDSLLNLEGHWRENNLFLQPEIIAFQNDNLVVILVWYLSYFNLLYSFRLQNTPVFLFQLSKYYTKITSHQSKPLTSFYPYFMPWYANKPNRFRTQAYNTSKLYLFYSPPHCKMSDWKTCSHKS